MIILCWNNQTIITSALPKHIGQFFPFAFSRNGSTALSPWQGRASVGVIGVADDWRNQPSSKWASSTVVAALTLSVSCWFFERRKWASRYEVYSGRLLRSSSPFWHPILFCSASPRTFSSSIILRFWRLLLVIQLFSFLFFPLHFS